MLQSAAPTCGVPGAQRCSNTAYLSACRLDIEESSAGRHQLSLMPRARMREGGHEAMLIHAQRKRDPARWRS